MKENAEKLSVQMDDAPSKTAAQQTELLFPNLNNGKPQATLENLYALLKFYNISCSYNLISKELLFDIPNFNFSSDNHLVCSMAFIASKMSECRLPLSKHEEYLEWIGEMNMVNPVLDWIKSKPWDGISRIKALCDTIKAQDEESKAVFIERWLYQAVALVMYENVDSAGILVLQGGQGVGKTWWFRKLVPEAKRKEFVRVGASVNPADRDSVSQIIRYWLVELGELDGTFRKSDIAALKGFLQNETDIMRRPFGRGDKTYPRRTAMAASVNSRIYLMDETGNRRFWTIACESINSYHDIDMQQLWAEIAYNLEKGKSWRMTKEEEALVNKINEEHQQIDPIEDKILNAFNWDSNVRDRKSATQIAEDLGLYNINQGTTRTIANIMRKLGSKEGRKGKSRVFDVPPKTML